MPLDELIREGARIMTICNACRYCEGFCAVFPAMEKRLTFNEADMNYLANLCHNCGECLRSCQYEPPHPFDVNVPRTLEKIRLRSYEFYCWPRALGAAFRVNGVATTLVVTAVLMIGMALSPRLIGHQAQIASNRDANFYSVISHGMMAATFGVVFLFVVAALAIGVTRYVKDTKGQFTTASPEGGVAQGLRDALSLKYLHGSDVDCTTAEGVRTPWRRWFHHFTFYGFLLCFASTTVATVYHFLGSPAPYRLYSLPVVLGTLGGIGLCIGPVGLWVIRRRTDQATLDASQQGLGQAFILTLILTSVSGLALLAFRETAAMTLLLIVHLAIVMTLFVTLPYGKFVHGFYRVAALIQYARETSSASQLHTTQPETFADAEQNAL